MVRLTAVARLAEGWLDNVTGWTGLGGNPWGLSR